MDPDEFNTDELNELKAAFNGTEYKVYQSRNNVSDVPDNFKGWFVDNAERAKGWKSAPYFIKENFNGGNISGGLKQIIASTEVEKIEKGLKFVENITMRYDYKTSGELYTDVTGFVSIIKSIIETGQKAVRIRLINELKTDKDLVSAYINKDFGTQIFKHEPTKILSHELDTAKKLTEVNFDVIFAPKGMFKTRDKKFDIFAIYKDKYLIKADLKANFEPTKNSIFKLVESGNKQAEHIVLDINSEISKNDLIDGLRSGLMAGKNVKSVMLFYKKQFFNLDRNAIFSKVIYKLLK